MKSIDLSHYYQLENSPLIHCLHNPNLQQELNQLSQIFIEKNTKSILFDQSILSLQIQQQNYQVQFNQLTDTFWHINKTIPNQHHLTSTTYHSIQQYLSNITDRFNCIEKYKIQLLQLQLSTD